MRGDLGRQHVDRDVRAFREVDQVPDLLAHHLRSANRLPQAQLGQDPVQLRRVTPGQDRLPAHSQPHPRFQVLLAVLHSQCGKGSVRVVRRLPEAWDEHQPEVDDPGRPLLEVADSPIPKTHRDLNGLLYADGIHDGIHDSLYRAAGKHHIAVRSPTVPAPRTA